MNMLKRETYPVVLTYWQSGKGFTRIRKLAHTNRPLRLSFQAEADGQVLSLCHQLSKKKVRFFKIPQTKFKTKEWVHIQV